VSVRTGEIWSSFFDGFASAGVKSTSEPLR
jgi:hypothetical protein